MNSNVNNNKTSLGLSLTENKGKKIYLLLRK